MPISDKDIKLLWGKAAGRCSKPDCRRKCFEYFEDRDISISITLGEMAHVIAESPNGPRGDGMGNDNSYDNLILLCPTHHREIDKAHDFFSKETLFDWKNQHEQWVSDKLSGAATYGSFFECCEAIKRLLCENKVFWEKYGPESEEALKNPYSTLAEAWVFQKLSILVPNNNKICEIIKTNETLIPVEHLTVFNEFKAHASGFAQNCYSKTEGISRFPKKFEEIIDETINKRIQ